MPILWEPSGVDLQPLGAVCRLPSGCGRGAAGEHGSQQSIHALHAGGAHREAAMSDMDQEPRARMRQQLQERVLVASEPDGGPVLVTGLIGVVLAVAAIALVAWLAGRAA